MLFVISPRVSQVRSLFTDTTWIRMAGVRVESMIFGTKSIVSGGTSRSVFFFYVVSCVIESVMYKQESCISTSTTASSQAYHT